MAISDETKQIVRRLRSENEVKIGNIDNTIAKLQENIASWEAKRDALIAENANLENDIPEPTAASEPI